MRAREARQAADTARLLRRLLAEVHAGRMDADPIQVAHIEGALTACEVLAGDEADAIVEQLRHLGQSDPSIDAQGPDPSI